MRQKFYVVTLDLKEREKLYKAIKKDFFDPEVLFRYPDFKQICFYRARLKNHSKHSIGSNDKVVPRRGSKLTIEQAIEQIKEWRVNA